MNTHNTNILNGLPGDDMGLAPGEARCPGRTVQEIIASDLNQAPAILKEERYRYAGSDDIAFSRYTSPDFFAKEMELVWTKVWQWACRLEHIPQVGDYYVYEIGPYSILVVHTPKGIKAYHNSCLHRGTKLKPEEGMGSSNQLRCPFHGWTWSLDGEIQSIPCAWDFPHVKPENLKLPEVRVGQWGGFIFVNLDDDAEDLESFLAEIPEHFSGWDMENRFTEFHVAKELPCNWKAATEAFLEAYHVMETHPQLLPGTGDANIQYDIYSDHVTRFYGASGVSSPHLETPLSEQELVDAMLVGDRSLVTDELEVKEGETARVVMARFLRKTLGEKYKVNLEDVSDAEMIDTIEYHLFPNMILFPGLSLPMVYRFRPLGCDPDRSLFEILFLRPLAPGAERPEAPEVSYIKEEESYGLADGIDAGMAYVYDQDTSNMRAQQQGFKAAKKKGETLGNYQEARIRHFHNVLDKYIQQD
ncbi:aromatic ring-hydroxylating oxygenase subunit alpha [Pseudomonas saliphila]|uniref:aromatic ring-hydroxylating oxygenase subunit alpha n=1 Tax=Pseudomonas saliphila TaxID=2586906 RepID=UPI00123A96EA|nr:aromatic ring-hydroxylating dioxygenase subunit alpha [Pseudomonas saliphila]